MIEIEGQHLILPRGRFYKFPERVLEIVLFDDVVVVRIEAESVDRNNENVYGVDFSGQLIWQIPWRAHLCPHSPYVSIYRHDAYVDAYNWDGHNLTIHPRTGQVFLETFLVAEPSRRHRSRAVRHFI